MPIVLVRIDDRLIHGQVVEGWLKTIHASHIVVVSDEVAQDKMQQTLLGMAVPSSIRVTNLAVQEAAGRIKDNIFEKERVMLLLSRPRDVLRLLEQGVKLPSVNVGGMHYTQGKKQLLRNLSVDNNDVSDLKEIGRHGVELEGRVLPADERVNIIEVLEKNQGRG
ncbi:MAG: PTS system mannose/fructose/N-acetylgalactosamine-transporter subunit IIB [Endomicrobiales bacterium]